MSNHEYISKFWFFVIPLSFLVVVLGFLIILIPSNTGLLITSNNLLGSSNFAYGQQEEQENQTNSNIITNSFNVQNISSKKVHVDDIDIAYKTFGKGDPIILINGYSFAMDSWPPTLLGKLAANQTVIIFDNRGIGNTTSDDEQQFSIGQFANDTAGLLEALKIKKADVLGWSMGGAIAQELALNYPDRVTGREAVEARLPGVSNLPAAVAGALPGVVGLEPPSPRTAARPRRWAPSVRATAS